MLIRMIYFYVMISLERTKCVLGLLQVAPQDNATNTHCFCDDADNCRDKKCEFTDRDVCFATRIGNGDNWLVRSFGCVQRSAVSWPSDVSEQLTIIKMSNINTITVVFYCSLPECNKDINWRLPKQSVSLCPNNLTAWRTNDGRNMTSGQPCTSSNCVLKTWIGKTDDICSWLETAMVRDISTTESINVSTSITRRITTSGKTRRSSGFVPAAWEFSFSMGIIIFLLAAGLLIGLYEFIRMKRETRPSRVPPSPKSASVRVDKEKSNSEKRSVPNTNECASKRSLEPSKKLSEPSKKLTDVSKKVTDPSKKSVDPVKSSNPTSKSMALGKK